MSGSAAAGTERFLNTLRVVGRMWGSHGDKISNAAQGRNFDDERAGFKSPGRAASPPPTGAGDESSRPGAGSPGPIIARQMSRDLPLGGSPAIARQASSVGGGRDGTGSPVAAILRQTSSRELGVGVGMGRADSPPPPLIGRQASRDLLIPDILRQQSRDRLPSPAATSPVHGASSSSSSGSGSGVNVTATGFRPIATPPASPTLQQQQQQQQQQQPTSPVSFLLPTLPPIANPTALRPGGANGPLGRSPSSGAGGGRASPSPSPLLRATTSDFEPIAVSSLPAPLLGGAAAEVSKGYHTAHRAEEAAAKAVDRVVGGGGEAKDGNTSSTNHKDKAAAGATTAERAAPASSKAGPGGGGGAPEPQQAKDAAAAAVDQGKAAPLTATEKADIVRRSHHHRPHHHKKGGGSGGGGEGRRKRGSLGASAGKGSPSAAEGAAEESWRPGYYLSRLLSSGSSTIGPEAAGDSSSKALVPAGPAGGEPNAA